MQVNILYRMRKGRNTHHKGRGWKCLRAAVWFNLENLTREDNLCAHVLYSRLENGETWYQTTILD